MSRVVPLPQPVNASELVLNETTLAQFGCVARRRTATILEVWEANLRDHYLVTLDSNQSKFDVVQLDSL